MKLTGAASILPESFPEVDVWLWTSDFQLLRCIFQRGDRLLELAWFAISRSTRIKPTSSASAHLDRLQVTACSLMPQLFRVLGLSCCLFFSTRRARASWLGHDKSRRPLCTRAFRLWRTPQVLRQLPSRTVESGLELRLASLASATRSTKVDRGLRHLGRRWLLTINSAMSSGA